MKAIKEGSLTPEAAIEAAFPSPFTAIKDISVDQLKVEPLATGFKFLDSRLVLKRNRPELIVVGARPGHGKSALLLQTAAFVSSMSGPVLFYSLEMDTRDLKARLVAPRIQRPLDKIMRGQISQKELHSASKAFESMQLNICANGRRNVGYLCQSALDFAKKTKPVLVVVDYIQKMTGTNNNTRTGEISEMLGQLKELAIKLGCPIFMASALNRNCEYRGKQTEVQKGAGRGDYKPIVSDLYESSAIEADADVILLLSRQYLHDRTRPNEADISVAKNRNGKVGSEIFQYSGELCSFYERSDYREDEGEI